MNNKFTVDIPINTKTHKYIFKLTLDKPTNTIIDKYSTKFRNDKIYQYEMHNSISDNTVRENILKSLFRDSKGRPTANDKIDKVAIKVTMLNAFYSTMINNDSLLAIANQIVHMKIDKRLRANTTDYDLVNTIAYSKEYFADDKNKFDSKYSFATKYCSWHVPNLYPIADSNSKGMLFQINRGFKYSKNDIFYNTKSAKTVIAKNLNEYKCYCDLYKSFKTFPEFGISKTNKEIDEYLWKYSQIELNEQNLQIYENENQITLESYNSNNTNRKMKTISDVIKINSDHFDAEKILKHT